jgi:hypothetical protein
MSVREEIGKILGKYWEDADIRYFRGLNPMPDQVDAAQVEWDRAVDGHITDILQVVKGHTYYTEWINSKGQPGRVKYACDKALTADLDDLPEEDR